MFKVDNIRVYPKNGLEMERFFWKWIFEFYRSKKDSFKFRYKKSKGMASLLQN